jgi:hypothetical protein
MTQLTTSPVKELRCHFCEGPVDLPQKGWELGRKAYCSAHHILEHSDPWVNGQSAIDYAESLHHMDPRDLIQWPWKAMNELAGPLAPGRLTYIAAFPGGGKTSFLTHCLYWWLSEGKTVTYLPLESDPGEVFVRLACLEVGASADDALSFRLAERKAAGDHEAMILHDDLTTAYRAFRNRRALLEQLRISRIEALTVRSFVKEVGIAQAMESDLIVVDHVDHVETEDGEFGSEIQTSNALQSEALKAAKRLNIPIVLATQLNSSRTGNDRLAHYRPPSTDWLYNKGKKEQMAANIIGLSRSMKPGIAPDWLSEVRAGVRPISDVVHDNRMAITGMKLRYGGAAKERTSLLAYERGRITDLDPADQRETLAARHGVLLGSPSERRRAS